MKKVKILVDSVCGLSLSNAADFGISVIPYYCYYHGKNYREGIDFDRQKFFKDMRTLSGADYPTTSGPTLPDLIDAYERARPEAAAIIHLVLSSSWTKTAALAEKAKREFPDTRIEVVDTKMAAGSLGFLAIEAARVARPGGSVDQVLERIGQVGPRRDTAVVFETLKYLARGGRIGRARALVGTILSIKPIIGIKDGIAVPLAKVMTHRQALNWIIERIRSARARLRGDRLRLVIEDIDNREWSERARDRLRSEFQVEECYQSPASVVIATHVGPGGWGVSWFIP